MQCKSCSIMSQIFVTTTVLFGYAIYSQAKARAKASVPAIKLDFSAFKDDTSTKLLKEHVDFKNIDWSTLNRNNLILNELPFDNHVPHNRLLYDVLHWLVC